MKAIWSSLLSSISSTLCFVSSINSAAVSHALRGLSAQAQVLGSFHIISISIDIASQPLEENFFEAFCGAQVEPSGR
jgi:hypothetical protein